MLVLSAPRRRQRSLTESFALPPDMRELVCLKPILTLTHRYFPLNGHAAPSARAGRCWPGSNQALPIPSCGPSNVRSASTSKGCWSRTNAISKSRMARQRAQSAQVMPPELMVSFFSWRSCAVNTGPKPPLLLIVTALAVLRARRDAAGYAFRCIDAGARARPDYRSGPRAYNPGSE